MNLRSVVGSAVNAGSLEMNEHERAVDRVAALGMSKELGSLLWRMKYGMQRRYSEITAAEIGQQAFTRACLLLERAVTHKEQRFHRKPGHRSELFPRLCQMALVAWLNDKCGACSGRGMLGVELTTVRSVRTECPECKGSGYGIKRVNERSPRHVCQRCSGNGAVQVTRSVDPGRPKPCPVCVGTGSLVLTSRQQAALLGVTVDLWDRVYDRLFARIGDVLSGVDKSTNSTVASQLERE